MMNLPQDLILASKSPRRQQILKDLGIPFSVHSMDVDESYDPSMKPKMVAEYLANKKNRAYRFKFKREIILTSDTTVVLGNEILNKPKDANEAVEMLALLSGKTHEVITGVCISDIKKAISFSGCTEVTFSGLSDDEIQYYVDRFKPLDKAGAYGIQEWIGMIGIREMKGDYYNVVGLPAHRVYQALKKDFSSALK